MSAARTVFQLRCSKDEKASWEACAALSGESMASWLRRLAREEVELRSAESAEIEHEKENRGSLMKVTYPQGEKKCRHVQMGQFCYICADKRFG